MLELLQTRRGESEARFTAAQAECEAILAAPTAEKRDLNAAEATAFGAARDQAIAARDEVKATETRIAEINEVIEMREATAAAARTVEPKATLVSVRGEEMTYRKGGEFSYFRDLAKAYAPGGGDQRARDRLERHRAEMDVETRANMNRTDGTGGEFVPPLWLLNDYVALARAGRVAANLLHALPLPPGTDSINLPKVATGSSTAAVTDGGVPSKTDMTTTSVSGAVTTLSGQQVFAMQLLDQSPINFDEVVFKDLLAALATNVDTFVLSTAVKGVLNLAGTNAVTYTDAAPTVPKIYPKVADGIQRIQTSRFLSPTAIVMHPRRWAWALASFDANNRPLVVPTATGNSYNSVAGADSTAAEGLVGNLQGLPVYVDPNIPTNLGAGVNEDRILIAKWDDLYLMEGNINTRVLFETDANTLEVRLQVWEYAANINDRYPPSIAIISGTGLITPTF